MQRILGSYSIIIIIAACSPGHNAFAQKSAAGYIITHEGDSIRGFIQEGTDAELETAIKFHQGSVDSPVKSFTAPALREFRFDYGRGFVRHTNSSGTGSAKDSIILVKRLISGKINLYTWERSMKGAPDIILVNNQTQKTVHLTKPEKNKLTTSGGTEYEIFSIATLGSYKW